MEAIEFEADNVQLSTIEALSFACSDPETRKLVSTNCSSYFLKSWQQTKDTNLRSAASIALVKIMGLNKDIQKEFMSGKMSEYFIGLLNSDQNDSNAQETAIEAISYLSLHPQVKSAIANNNKILDKIGSFSVSDRISIQFGIAMIYYNLTAFPNPLTEEQKQVQKLQAMANGSTDIEEHVETHEQTMKRIDILARANVITNLVILGKLQSENVREMVSSALCCFATNPKHRGLIVQAGGCKLLLSLTAQNTEKGCIYACHALSKIAITTDPNLAFRGEMAFELVRPLAILLSSDQGLQNFESLMALTNLASISDEIRSKIVSPSNKVLQKVQELQFSDNVMIRRAATECLCNLILDETVFEAYSNTSTTKNTPLKIMVALCDEDDFATRRAASGFLAVFSSVPVNVNLLTKNEYRIHEILSSLLTDDNDEIIHRSLAICANFVSANYSRSNEIKRMVVKIVDHSNPVISEIAKSILS